MDTVSRQTRSLVMSRVKSKGNRSTEWRLRASLIRAGVKGWKVNPRDISGLPDFAFPVEGVVVFTDGCFWHGCPTCKRTPSSNVDYWDRKIRRNRDRDTNVTATLRRQGWKVLRVWEHQLDSLDTVVHRIARLLEGRRKSIGCHPNASQT